MRNLIDITTLTEALISDMPLVESYGASVQQPRDEKGNLAIKKGDLIKWDLGIYKAIEERQGRAFHGGWLFSLEDGKETVDAATGHHDRDADGAYYTYTDKKGNVHNIRAYIFHYGHPIYKTGVFMTEFRPVSMAAKRR